MDASSEYIVRRSSTPTAEWRLGGPRRCGDASTHSRLQEQRPCGVVRPSGHTRPTGGGTVSPSEFATTFDSRLSATLSTVRDRLSTVHAAGRTRLAAVLDRFRQPDEVDGSPTHDPARADTPPIPPRPGRTPGSDTTPAPDHSPHSDSGTGPSGDDSPGSSFPVLADEPERELNDVLLERGLTREEYVLEILDEHDGRLRQQRIKEYTGWSAASVSRLLGRMEDAERITRFRIGNEKVVCVPDADPRRAIFETEISVST